MRVDGGGTDRFRRGPAASLRARLSPQPWPPSALRVSLTPRGWVALACARGRRPIGAYAGRILGRAVDRIAGGVWERGLATPAEPVQAQLVVEDADGEVAGFVVTGPTRSGEGTGEVRVLNVEPTRWGRGLGRLLLAAAVDELRSGGHAAAILWVVEGNVRGPAFYESAGWHLDGGTMVDDRFGTGVVEVRYRLQLPDTRLQD